MKENGEMMRKLKNRIVLGIIIIKLYNINFMNLIIEYKNLL